MTQLEQDAHQASARIEELSARERTLEDAFREQVSPGFFIDQRFANGLTTIHHTHPPTTVTVTTPTALVTTGAGAAADQGRGG